MALTLAGISALAGAWIRRQALIGHCAALVVGI